MAILSNYDLNEMMKKFNINNVKIMSKDDIYDNKYKKYIINMDDNKGKGTHWVGLIDNYYFDSFGLKPPNVIANLFNGKYYYNDKQFQFLKSNNCGWFVFYFILYFNNKNINNNSYKKFLDSLNTYNNNDDTIIKYINNSILN
jgi:hypothetical protein